jgi:hypothetical protein
VKPPRISTAWLLFGAAFVLRVGWVAYRWRMHGPTLDYPDEDLHWQLATHLVRDGTLVSDDGRFAARMPLYPLFLALFAGCGSVGVLLAKLAQAGLGAVTTVIGYRLAKAAMDRRAALVAGVLIACDPFAIFFANLLLSEVPFTLVAIGLTACAWGVRDAPAKKAPLLGLALLGPAAILTRPSAAGWVPLLWLLIVVLSALRYRARKKAGAGTQAHPVIRLLVCPAVLIVLLLPWGLRNRAVLGSYAWLSTNGGVTLYDAQGPQADGSSNQAFLRERTEFQGLDEVALDETLRRRALEQMRNHPSSVLHLAGVKLLRTWSPLPNVAEYRGGLAALVGAVYTVLIIVGAVVGLGRILKTGRPSRTLMVLIWLPVLYFTLLHCIYIGSVRYRVPLLPFLALAASTAWQRPISAARS